MIQKMGEGKMSPFFAVAMRQVAVNTQGMHTLDWMMLLGTIAILLGVLIYCSKFMRNAADFLAASRCAGRYVLSISEGIAGFAVVNSVGTWEAFLHSGFAATWWGFISTPFAMILTLVAWTTYRMRETRCFTLAQFYEVRYSRKLRIGAGILTWISGVLNYGIFPMVSVRFFIFFCRLEPSYRILGIEWNTYGTLLAIALSLGVFFAAFGGQIAIMVTDFLQGIFCNIAFVIFILFTFKLGEWDICGGLVSWDEIAEALNKEPGYSHINPFQCTKYSDFNVYYYLIGLLAVFYGRGTWQGSAGYAAAAKNPHERKMAGVLGTWRGFAQGLMIMLFPLVAIVITRLPSFSWLNEMVQNQLASTTDATLKLQGIVPTVLSMIMPSGMIGLFAAVMFAAMLSTDDTYIHSWGSVLIQDVIMPFRKKPFTAKQHITALRLSIIFVGVFSWVFGFFYRQNTPVALFFQLTGAIVSGAGAAVVGGLYWKRGGTLAAWVSYIFGATTGIAGIIIPLCWKDSLAPYLWNRFHWQWVGNNMDWFPIHGQWISLINMVSCSLLYVVISLIEHYVMGKPDFNLDKMLHRGKYSIDEEHVKSGNVNKFLRIFGVTEEFSFGDKVIYFASIVWTFSWMFIFVWFTVQYFLFGKFTRDGWIGGVPDSQWLALWHVKIYITLILGIACTVWFMVGGIIDVKRLFSALKKSARNDADDGTVVDGGNAGEKRV